MRTTVTDDGHDLLWYAAYGSNLSTTRFRCYLEGGRPAGASRTYEACGHGERYRDTQPVPIDRPLSFGRSSSTWDGGGVAFVDHAPSADRLTYGRAYLLSVRQLLHVARQENRLTHELELVAWRSLTTSKPLILDVPTHHYYTVLLPLGSLDGRPLVTLTGASGSVQPNEPSRAYRQTIVRGLRETWPELSTDAIDDYLTAAGGPKR